MIACATQVSEQHLLAPNLRFRLWQANIVDQGDTSPEGLRLELEPMRKYRRTVQQQCSVLVTAA